MSLHSRNLFLLESHVDWQSGLTFLCRWPSDGLFERVNARIKAQIDEVEDLTGDMDPKTNFSLIVIQTELERYKFLVRSFLRARMAKVREAFFEPAEALYRTASCSPGER